MKAILEFFAKNNRWAIVLVALLLIVGGGIFRIQNNRIKEWKGKHESEVKLKNALVDTVRTYQNKEGQWVAEKLTIQAELKDLTNDKVVLTAEQKRLIDKVNAANKENEVIAAALVRADFVIDSLINDSAVVDTTNKTIEFIEVNNPDIQYKFKAFGVLPYPPDTKPTLLIKNLTLPNEAFIKFQWDKEKRANFPITFSITNSNQYVKVTDMNSYAIPELDKVVINPTGWQKVGQWFKKNGKVVGYVAGGVAVGAAGTYVIMQ
jgi:predicted RND superfamily exporter protein